MEVEVEVFGGTDRGRQHIRFRTREVGRGIPRVAELGMVALVLAAFVELDSGEASDHQPLVVDFEAVAFDAGE